MKRLATVFASFAAALLTAGPARADVVLAINEGVTYYVTPTEIREKYKDLADLPWERRLMSGDGRSATTSR